MTNAFAPWKTLTGPPDRPATLDPRRGSSCSARSDRRTAPGLPAPRGTTARESSPAGGFPRYRRSLQYGSVGTEERVGVPYWIWRVLPTSSPTSCRSGRARATSGWGSSTTAPRTAARSGRPTAHGRVDLVGLNCATCHAGTYPRRAGGAAAGRPRHAREPDGPPGLRAIPVGLRKDPPVQRHRRSSRPSKEARTSASFDSLMYRWFVDQAHERRHPRTRQRERLVRRRPPQGPGRVDTFNPYKVCSASTSTTDETVGTADLPSLWNQRMRRGLWLHWDGNNNSVDERNKSAAIGAGATPDSLDLPRSIGSRTGFSISSRRRIPRRASTRRWRTRAGDLSAASARAATTSAQPQSARSPTSPTSAPIRERLDSFTRGTRDEMNTIGTGKPWRFSHFRKTNGYASMPLDGIWLRAPYLHNGSVPTLRALLFLDERPAGSIAPTTSTTGRTSASCRADPTPSARRDVRHARARQRQRRARVRRVARRGHEGCAARVSEDEMT